MWACVGCMHNSYMGVLQDCFKCMGLFRVYVVLCLLLFAEVSMASASVLVGFPITYALVCFCLHLRLRPFCVHAA